MRLIKRYAPFLFKGTRVVTAMVIITVKLPAIFFTRATDHVGVSNLTGKRLKNVKNSAVLDYLLQCNCTVDFDHLFWLLTSANLIF